jgi:hypothetical protein
MKTLKMIALILLFAAFSNSAEAQERIALVDYMRVPEGGGEDYVALEKEVWKPIHQEMVNNGKLEGWFLYQIPYPGGTDAEYHYVTVRLYNDRAQIENTWDGMNNAFEKAHPGKDVDEIDDKTMASRDLVKTYCFSSWERFMSEDLEGPTKLIDVVYFKVAMDKRESYQEMERKFYHPTHKAEMKAGTRAGWEGWILRRPFGESIPFNFVAVDHYKDYAQYIKQNPEGLFEDVFEGNELDRRDDIFNETAKLVLLEEWHLIDFAMAPPSDEND